MKITASILILLIFAMAFAPCGDTFEMETSQQVEQISKSSIEDAGNFDNETDKQQEECSPICPCQCCPSIASDSINLTEIASIIPLDQIPELKNSIFSYVSFLIWSPPQFLS
ncbi:MAG: DUF6660 family protein [Balneolaceae bacterium]